MSSFIDEWLFDPVVGKLVALLIGLLVLITLVKFFQGVLGRHIADTDTRYRARKFVSLLGYVAGIFVVAMVFSDRLGGLTVALGVAGAGIAFALQEVIASVAGWLAVFLSSFYKVGDRVQLGGTTGDVIDIGILRTTLMETGQWVKGDQYTGRVVRVANSFVFKEPVYNYSGDFPFLWDEISIPVTYESDQARTRQILEKIAEELLGDYASGAEAAWKELVSRYKIEDARVRPMVTLVANDNWVEYTVRYVVDYKSRRVTKDRLFTRIMADVAATGGSVAFASATFHLVGAPRLDVRLEREGPPGAA